MSIITGGYGKGSSPSSIILQGYGKKWVLVSRKKRKVRYMFCPFCEDLLLIKVDIYKTHDPVTHEWLYRCKKCYRILQKEDRKLKPRKFPYVDEW